MKVDWKPGPPKERGPHWIYYNKSVLAVTLSDCDTWRGAEFHCPLDTPCPPTTKPAEGYYIARLHSVHDYDTFAVWVSSESDNPMTLDDGCSPWHWSEYTFGPRIPGTPEEWFND